jgi:hypothetical protein
MLWKRAFKTPAGELGNRGYRAVMETTDRSDPSEKFRVRIAQPEGYVELFVRKGYWKFHRFEKQNGKWKRTVKSEVVQDRSFTSGFAILDLYSGTPHQKVIDALEYNFTLNSRGA